MQLVCFFFSTTSIDYKTNNELTNAAIPAPIMPHNSRIVVGNFLAPVLCREEKQLPKGTSPYLDCQQAAHDSGATLRPKQIAPIWIKLLLTTSITTFYPTMWSQPNEVLYRLISVQCTQKLKMLLLIFLLVWGYLQTFGTKAELYYHSRVPLY